MLDIQPVPSPGDFHSWSPSSNGLPDWSMQSDPCWCAANPLGDLSVTLAPLPMPNLDDSLHYNMPPTPTAPSNLDLTGIPNLNSGLGLSLSPSLLSAPSPSSSQSTPTQPQPHLQPTPSTTTMQSNPSSTIISLLLSQGVNINVQNARGQTPLHMAAQSGQLAVVRQLLAARSSGPAGQIDVNARDLNGSTPLHLASEMGHVEVVRVLVENGARVDVRSGDGGIQ